MKCDGPKAEEISRLKKVQGKGDRFLASWKAEMTKVLAS